MPLAELNITLSITNNRDYTQSTSVMGNETNLLDTSNATTEYRYDITGFTFTDENTVSIQYRATGSSEPYNLFISDLSGFDNQAIVDSLNLLGIGFFNLYTELGETYIGTYNETTEFADLNVFNTPIPPSQQQVTTQAVTTQDNQVLLTQNGIILQIQ
jgi:hypothetical protein